MDDQDFKFSLLALGRLQIGHNLHSGECTWWFAKPKSTKSSHEQNGRPVIALQVCMGVIDKLQRDLCKVNCEQLLPPQVHLMASISLISEIDARTVRPPREQIGEPVVRITA